MRQTPFTTSTRSPSVPHRAQRYIRPVQSHCVTCGTSADLKDLDVYGSCEPCIWAMTTQAQNRRWQLRWPTCCSFAALLTGLGMLLWPLWVGSGVHLTPPAAMLMLVLGGIGVWAVYQGSEGRQQALHARAHHNADPVLMWVSTATLVAGNLTTGIAIFGFSLG